MRYHEIPDELRTKRKLRHDEDAMQSALVARLRLQCPPEIIWFHCANAPKSKIDGARLKAMGMLAGVPDLMFIIPQPDSHPAVCFLELKRPSIAGSRPGKPSAGQVLFAERCEAIGVEIATAYNIDQAVSVLTAWGCLPEAI